MGFRGCGKTQIVCHSERSEESLSGLSPVYREILRRKARLRMTTNCFFHTLFTLKLQGLKPVMKQDVNGRAEARPS
jgi:hypothetical protein